MPNPNRPARGADPRRWMLVSSGILVAGALAVAALLSTSAQARAEAAPINQSLPTISGSAAVGKALTATGVATPSGTKKGSLFSQ